MDLISCFAKTARSGTVNLSHAGRTTNTTIVKIFRRFLGLDRVFYLIIYP